MKSPYEVAEAIEQVQADIERLVDDVKLAGITLADADVDFKVAFAKRRLERRAHWASAGKSDAQATSLADDEATVDTEEERRNFLIATHALTVIREALRAKESELDGYRTLSASIRLAGG